MIRFERAAVSDAMAIAELDRHAWQDNRNPEFIPDGEHVWRVWVEHALVFCARADHRVVGAVLGFPCVSGIYCLHKIFVDRALRGAGIGNRLLALFLAEADKRRLACFLTVDPENHRALRLYKGLGFREKEFVKGYYRSYEDRLVLERQPGAVKEENG